MDLGIAIGTVLNGEITTTRIGELSHKDLDLVKDMIEALDDARSAKAEYDSQMKDSANPLYSATERTEHRKWAEEAMRDYSRAKRRLADLTEKSPKVAAC